MKPKSFCYTCNRKYGSGLPVHLRSLHNGENKPPAEPEGILIKPEPIAKGYEQEIKTDIKMFQPIYKDDKVYFMCPLCEKKTKNFRGLKQHLIKGHFQNAVNFDSIIPYVRDLKSNDGRANFR